jgi:hypothetical protein
MEILALLFRGAYHNIEIYRFERNNIGTSLEIWTLPKFILLRFFSFLTHYDRRNINNKENPFVKEVIFYVVVVLKASRFSPHPHLESHFCVLWLRSRSLANATLFIHSSPPPLLLLPPLSLSAFFFAALSERNVYPED